MNIEVRKNPHEGKTTVCPICRANKVTGEFYWAIAEGKQVCVSCIAKHKPGMHYQLIRMAGDPWGENKHEYQIYPVKNETI